MKQTRPRSGGSKRAHPPAGPERVLTGLGVSPGIALGPAYRREGGQQLTVVEYQVPRAALEGEQQRIVQALRKAESQLTKLRAKAEAVHGAAAEELGFLLEAHLQMLKSRRLGEGIKRRILEESRNAEAAVAAEIAAIEEEFLRLPDPYLASRGSEIREVGRRLLRNLSDRPFASFGQVPEGSVILAEEVTPADTALMDPKLIVGFASVLGGAEGHTAIMARSLGLPAVLGVPALLAGIKTGTPIIVDGDEGRVIINPSAETIALLRRRQTQQRRVARSLAELAGEPAITLDGERVQLLVNVDQIRDLAPALAAGAEGIGLLRTEFLFMNRSDVPSEDEQTAFLGEIMAAMGGRPVTARTLDVGGEKLATALGRLQPEGPNPALGMRAIRLSLREPVLLETQLASMLRAAALGPLRILLPMITDASEIQAVRDALGRVYHRLKRRRVTLPEQLPPVGVMIEVPGAALAADALAREADFFAIGTNDLTMYTLAIDRSDERVAHLYNPLHPAVLRLIQFSTEAALRARLPISVCGEMAADPRFTPLFLGLGIRELSVGAQALGRVKQRVRSLQSDDALRLADRVMRETDSAAIARLLAEA